MIVVNEKVVYHLTGGDYIVSNRVRYYPYKVSYVDLYDYMKVPNGSALPVHTDIIRARDSEDAKSLFRSGKSSTIAFISAGRHPERLGRNIVGSQYTTLTKAQLKALDREVQSGAAKLPHPINPAAFVTNNPNSTVHHRPARDPRFPRTYTRPTDGRGYPSQTGRVGASPSVAKSTPIQLSSSVLDVGGFSVGFRKPGDPAPPVPTVSRPTPQPDLYNLANTTVPGGTLASQAVADAPSSVAMPSGFYQFSTAYGVGAALAATKTPEPVLEPTPNYSKFVTKDGVTHDAVAVPHVDNIIDKLMTHDGAAEVLTAPMVTDVAKTVPMDVKAGADWGNSDFIAPRYVPPVNEPVPVKVLDTKPEVDIDTAAALEAAEDATAKLSKDEILNSTWLGHQRPNPFFYADPVEPRTVGEVKSVTVEPERKKVPFIWGLIGLGLAGIIHLVKPSKRD